MTRLRTLVLAAAPLASFATAALAENTFDPEPLAMVEACDAYGTGWFIIPGSETCLKLSGEVSVSAGRNRTHADGFGRTVSAFAGASAAVSFETKSDSEYGTVGTVLAVGSDTNFDAFYGYDTPYRTTDVKEAYITLGPAFAGYRHTLFNLDRLYGDYDDRDGSSSMSAGFFSRQPAGGFYYGLAVESDRRGAFLDGYDAYESGYDPEFVARIGYDGGSLGSFDLAGIYGHKELWSGTHDNWLLKATADVDAMAALSIRASASMGRQYGSFVWETAGAAAYDVTERVDIYAGLGYRDLDHARVRNVYANAGLTFRPLADLSVNGQLTWGNYLSDDSWAATDKNAVNTSLSVTRKF